MKYNVREGDYRTMGAVVHNDGVVFTFEGRKEQKCSIVLYEKKTGKIGKIPVPDTYYVGALRSIMVMGIEPASFDYNFEIDGKVMTDPYARRIVGREKWGEKERFGMDYQVKSGFSTDVFDWEEDVAPEIAKKDMVMYKLHVRNFTMEGSNGGARKGTFEAVENRIGYLRDMGGHLAHAPFPVGHHMAALCHERFLESPGRPLPGHLRRTGLCAYKQQRRHPEPGVRLLRHPLASGRRLLPLSLLYSALQRRARRPRCPAQTRRHTALPPHATLTEALITPCGEFSQSPLFTSGKICNARVSKR